MERIVVRVQAGIPIPVEDTVVFPVLQLDVRLNTTKY